MRAVRCLILFLFLLLFFVTVSGGVPQDERFKKVELFHEMGDGREVVQSSEILEKIERGEPVNYVGKVIEGDIICRDLKLPEITGIPVKLKEVRSSLTLQSCIIKGTVDFSLSAIFGKVNFRYSQFSQPASFSLSQFTQFADFSDSYFKHPADFSNSNFYQAVDFSGAKFGQNAYFFGAQFNESAFFNQAQFNQSVEFSSAEFDQDSYFSWCKFNQSADFGGARFGMDAIFDQSYLKSADFSSTSISNDLSLKGTEIEHLSLNDAQIGEIVLRPWKNIGHMEYDEMAYQSLLSSFKNRNLPDEANECYYDYRNARRATLNVLYQPADYALMLFYGYGVKPERPVIWAFVLITIFTSFFWWRQGILPVRDGEPEEEANRFTLPEAAAFSAMTFLSGGKLVFDPPEYRIAPGRPWRDVQICKALFVWERLMGMILIVMFAIAVSKTIILGS